MSHSAKIELKQIQFQVTDTSCIINLLVCPTANQLGRFSFTHLWRERVTLQSEGVRSGSESEVSEDMEEVGFGATW